MNISVCDEHIDLALDMIVDECEVAPKLENMQNKAVEKCNFCQNQATYVVSN